jgi:hypothetical protein
LKGNLIIILTLLIGSLVRGQVNKDIENATRFFNDLEAVLKKMGKDNPALEDFNNFLPANDAEAKIKQFMLPILSKIQISVHTSINQK